MSLRWLLIAFLAPAFSAPRPLTVEDMSRLREVRDPQCSPDGKSVAYVVSSIDTKEDKSVTHIWIASYDGTRERQVTFSEQGESSPRWSPDGRFLAFTSSRGGKDKGSQIWLLPSDGGEAHQVTHLKGGLRGFEWAPDSKRMALVVADPDPDKEPEKDAAKPKPPKPIVIERYRFKADRDGYLRSGRDAYVYLFEIATEKLERLTSGKWAESAPQWSPTGDRIAFLSNHNADPDREPRSELYVADAKPGVEPKLIAKGLANRRADWSPDGKSLVFLESDEKKWDAYNMDHLVVAASDGATPPRKLRAVEALDRSVSAPSFTRDGKAVEFLVIDDRSVYPARADLAGASAEKLMAPPVVIASVTRGAEAVAALTGGDAKPNEVYAIAGGERRQLSHQNDALLAELALGATEDVQFRSADGTEVHGLLTTPPGHAKGAPLPFLLRIHGGPNGQDQHSFSLERQMFAAQGYAVLAVNYRGSAGRGQKFSRAIAADWGNYEVQDLIAGVNHAIKTGAADAERLGVGGWSYGGILTDYLIASDTRFKAATSGAGTAFTVSFYGTDQYIIQYDNEIGPPWNAKSWQTYVKLSYPFLHADRIKTPTLFLGGEKDFNVPIEGSQQMYQALRGLGIDTQLIIYPGEYHSIDRPSFQRDRMQRYLDWYAKYLRKTAGAASGAR